MYASLDDIQRAIGEDRLLRIADRDGDDQIDGGVVDDALVRASAEIDAAISKRYKLPMRAVPALVKSIAIDLAHYHLDLDPVDDLRKRAEDARRLLMSIAKGDYTLEDAELAESGEAAQTGGQNINEAAVKSFQSGLNMSGF